MPQIREFNAPEGLGLKPSELGISATAAGARVIGAEYGEAAAATSGMGERLGGAVKVAGDAVVKYMEAQEISTKSRVLAEKHERVTKDLNEALKTADPNDTGFAARFMKERLDPELKEFEESFFTEGGQNWARGRIAAFREHVFTNTTAIQSKMAGDAAVINELQKVNALSNTVRSDPSSIRETLSILDSSFDATVAASPNLTATQVSDLRKHHEMNRGTIVKAAFIGMAEKNPDEAMRRAQDPTNEWSKYINQVDVRQIVNYAKQQNKLNEMQGRADAQELKRMEAEDFNSAINDLEVSTFPKPGETKRTIGPEFFERLRDISEMPGAKQYPGRLRSTADMFETILRQQEQGIHVISDPILHTDFRQRAALLVADPKRLSVSEITIAVADEKLSERRGRELTAVLTANARDEKLRLDLSSFNRFADSFKRNIMPSEGVLSRPSAQDAQRWGAFYDEAKELYEDNLARGIARHDLLHNKNHPAYIGRIVEKYERDSKARLQELRQNLRGSPGVIGPIPRERPRDWSLGAPAVKGDKDRRPGESLDEWKKRRGL